MYRLLLCEVEHHTIRKYTVVLINVFCNNYYDDIIQCCFSNGFMENNIKINTRQYYAHHTVFNKL